MTTHEASTPHFLSTRQMAERLGIAPWTVREWTRRGLTRRRSGSGTRCATTPAIAADLARATDERRS